MSDCAHLYNLCLNVLYVKRSWFFWGGGVLLVFLLFFLFKLPSPFFFLYFDNPQWIIQETKSCSQKLWKSVHVCLGNDVFSLIFLIMFFFSYFKSSFFCFFCVFDLWCMFLIFWHAERFLVLVFVLFDLDKNVLCSTMCPVQ